MSRRRVIPLALVVLGAAFVGVAVVQGPGGIEGAYFTKPPSAPSRFAVLKPNQGSFWAGAGIATIVVGVGMGIAWRRPSS